MEFSSDQVTFLETAVPIWRRESLDVVNADRFGQGGLSANQVKDFAEEVVAQLGVSAEVAEILIRGLESEFPGDVVERARAIISQSVRSTEPRFFGLASDVNGCMPMSLALWHAMAEREMSRKN